MYNMAFLSFIPGLTAYLEPGRRSQYSDSLRAGRSGDRIPVGARFSAPIQTGSEAPPSLLYNGYRVFPGGKGGRGVPLTAHPLLRAQVYKKSRAIPLLSLRASAAYNRVKP
jgi:hypothetical protein